MVFYLFKQLNESYLFVSKIYYVYSILFSYYDYLFIDSVHLSYTFDFCLLTCNWIICDIYIYIIYIHIMTHDVSDKKYLKPYSVTICVHNDR